MRSSGHKACGVMCSMNDCVGVTVGAGFDVLAMYAGYCLLPIGVWHDGHER